MEGILTGVDNESLKHVAIQFTGCHPDITGVSLVSDLASQRPSVRFFLLSPYCLSDSFLSTNSCDRAKSWNDCIDFLGAQHYSADALFVVGGVCPLCLSKLQSSDSSSEIRLVKFVPLPMVNKLEIFKQNVDFKKGIVIVESTFLQLFDSADIGPNFSVATVSNSPLKVNYAPHRLEKLGLRVSQNCNQNLDEELPYFYIGQRGTLLNMLLTVFPDQEFLFLDPTTTNTCFEKVSLQSSKLLVKRSFFANKIRRANILGIIVLGPVFSTDRESVFKQVKLIQELAKHHNKKTYKFYIDYRSLNSTKLGNFLEVDCYVVVPACPFMAAALLSSDIASETAGKGLKQDSFQAVCTLLDVQIALASDDLVNSILSSQNTSLNLFGVEDSSLSSLIRSAEEMRINEETIDGNGQLLSRNDADFQVAMHTADNFLQQRSFKGLEQRLGKDEPSNIEQGRSGIASGYTAEGL